MATRSDVETGLHRLANYVECRLADILRDLLAESRPDDAASIAREGCGFVSVLREIGSESEGGAV